MAVLRISLMNKRCWFFSSRFSWFAGLLLVSSLLISGCEGSRLGNRLGESLEPDPQLAEDSNGADENASGDSGGAGAAENKPEGEITQKPTSGAANSENEKPEDAPKEDEPPAVTAGDYTDIGKAPEEIQAYLVDLLEMDLLEVRAPATPTPAPTSNNADDDADEEGSADGDSGESEAEAPAPQPTANPPAPDEFRPNQAITRREYARWLLAVNNRFYLGERDRKIRPGVTSSQPVFSDVPVSDPDFADIQGLAEAGIIPSPLTGSSTNVTFRPNAPLTRKDMVLWKVPLDTRQALPVATVTDVQQVWGFQDAAKIEPRALQAVLADHQNGDFANFRRAYSYTTLFQPDKAATRAEAAAVLWRFGNPAEGITAQELRGTRQNDG
ncbi:MAG: S-layer homology domain-containing protein [Cyanobacteria bacterium J06631_9]